MNGPGRRTLGVGVGAVLVLALAAVFVVALQPNKATAPSKSTATPPTTQTAKSQLAWLIAASHHLPVSPADLNRHFVPGYFHDDYTQTFEGLLVNLGPLSLKTTRPPSAPGSVSAVTATVNSSGTTTKYTTELSVSSSGLIDRVSFLALLPAPTTWPALDRRVRALAPHVSFASERIGPQGNCRLIHGLNAGTPHPLGSAFKLYVLGALARAVADGHARWDQKLAIRSDWKSTGALASRPAGTKLTLRTFADDMISASDNTAADHLLHFVGRIAVQRQLSLFGNAKPRLSTPFLTTRQLFLLRAYHYPQLAGRYLAASRAGRARLLDRKADIPLSAFKFSGVPRDVESIEWFGSPEDMCQAFSGLLQQDRDPRLKPVGGALSINDGSLLLNPVRYPVTWFKGGSEPGVLTENYLVKAADGAVLVNSVMITDPRRALDDQTVTESLAVIRGAVALDHAR